MTEDLPTSSHSDLKTLWIETIGRELATELDFHYEDDELWMQVGALRALEAAQRLLEAEGRRVPSAIIHVLGRVRRDLH